MATKADAATRKSASDKKLRARKKPRIVTLSFNLEQIQAIRILLGGQGVVVPNPPRPHQATVEIDVASGE